MLHNVLSGYPELWQRRRHCRNDRSSSHRCNRNRSSPVPVPGHAVRPLAFYPLPSARRRSVTPSASASSASTLLSQSRHPSVMLRP